MRKRRWITILRRLWIGAGLCAMILLWVSFQARGVDPVLLRDGLHVHVTDTAEALGFEPQGVPPGAGLIFLPGAMVDPVAYAPLARALAERGVRVVLVKLPLRLAASQAQQAEVVRRIQLVIAEQPAVAWALAGHSRGAALAGQLALRPDLKIKRLILIGTSHPKAAAWDLAQSELAVTKIYATHDGLAAVDEVLANGRYLPPSTRWVRIEGGNHAQFGWYGPQIGDGRATISRADQQSQLIDALAVALTHE